MRVVGVFACCYRVHLAYAGANKPRLDEAIDIQAATDDGRPRNHHVSFNRAVAASQAFGRKFPDVDQLLENHKTLAIEKWPKAASEWLQNGLLDDIVDFIQRAKGRQWALDIAIYEYELKAIVEAVNAAHKRGVKVRSCQEER